jgi:hypothetical protein
VRAARVKTRRMTPRERGRRFSLWRVVQREVMMAAAQSRMRRVSASRCREWAGDFAYAMSIG